MENWVNVTYQQVVFGHGQCIILADAQFQCQAVGVVLSKHESVVDKLEVRKAGSGICSGLNPKLLSPFSQQQAQASQFLSIHFFIKSNGRFARKMATDVIQKTDMAGCYITTSTVFRLYRSRIKKSPKELARTNSAKHNVIQ